MDSAKKGVRRKMNFKKLFRKIMEIQLP